MRIPSGVVDQVIFFVAVDATDLKTRETGLTTFTVYRARDTGAATAMTTPTVTELSAANMPGVYSLLLDEDMTIAAGNDSEEMIFHITQAAMAPVTRTIELYRPKITAGETVTAANGAADADIERLQGSLIATPTVAGVLEVDVTHWIGTAAATPTVAGVPEVDVTHFNGTAGTFSAGRPEVNTSHVAGTAQTAGDIIADTNDIQTRLPAALVSGRMDASVGAMAAGTVTAAAIATGAIDADALAASAVEKILQSVSGTADSTTTTTVTDTERTEADTDYWKDSIIVFTAGPAVGQMRRISAFNATTDVITVDTAFTTSPGANTYVILRSAMALAAAAGSGDWTTAEKEQIRDALGIDGTKTAAVSGDIQDIQARLPAALVTGRIDASVGAMAAGVVTAAAVATGAIDADALAADAATEIRSLASGTADSGTTTTMVDAARTEADTDYWKGQLIAFTSGTLLGQTRLITAFNPATDTITFEPATTVAVATHTYEILPAGAVNVRQWLETTVATPTVAGVPEVDVTHWLGTAAATPTVAGVPEVDVTHWRGTAAAAPTVAGVPAVETIDISAAGQTDIRSAVGLATANLDTQLDALPTAAEVADAVLDEDMTAHQTLGTLGQAIGDPVADTNTIYKAVVTDAAGATVGVDVVAVQADTDDIQARLPAALTAGGNIKADVLAISGATESADRIERSTLSIVTGTIGTGSTTTSIVASAVSPASAVNDQFKGRIMNFDKDTTTAALRGQSTDITAYTHATTTFTVTALTTAPVSGDTFTIT